MYSFANDTLYVENPKESTKNYYNKFRKGHKTYNINIQKSITLLYISNKQLGNEIKKSHIHL